MKPPTPKKWISGAIKAPGSLRRALKAKPGMPIPEAKLEKAEKAPGRLGRRARLAETLKKLPRAHGRRSGGMDY